MMMWMDRELVDDHQVYDHYNNPNNLRREANGSLGGNNGSGPRPDNGDIYGHSSTPTTTNSMAMESSLGGGSPTAIGMDLDIDGSLHQHSTLPAVDHRLPMDNHHLDGGHIYEPQQHLYHHPHQLQPSNSDHGGGDMLHSNGLGPFGDHETAMMMQQSPNGDMSDCHGHLHHDGEGGKNPSGSGGKTKDRKNYLQIYARQFGLNDRGCYVAVGLAALAFLLFVIIVAMGVTWPGKIFLHAWPRLKHAT
jgi:hypothetical protein